jgi:cytosine/adenosine deaminase-related metal-dependent hydrolase
MSQISSAIFGSYVLTHRNSAQEVLRDRWVLVEGKRIAAVTRDKPAADQVFDRPGRFVLPGLLNLHNHCFSEAVARTHTEDGHARANNQSIVYTVLLPLTKAGTEILSRDERLAVARLGILQLLKGGATTVMGPLRNGIPEMFDAAEGIGIRFYGAPYLFSTSDAKAGNDGVFHYAGDDGRADLDAWNALHAAWHGRGDGRIRLAISPHATDTCSPDLLRACAARARELDVPITIHLGQSDAEVAVIKARHDGASPAEYLDGLGLLAPDLLAAHCVSSTDDDLKLMAARGATVLNCPRVFARAGRTAAFSRFARAWHPHAGRHRRIQHGPARRIERGINDLQSHDGRRRCRHRAGADRCGDTKRRRRDKATRSRYAHAGCDGRCDRHRPEPSALPAARRSAPGLVALANRANVDLVIVDGRVLIDEGRYTGGDEAAIAGEGVAAIRRIWALPEARAAFGDGA